MRRIGIRRRGLVSVLLATAVAGSMLASGPAAHGSPQNDRLGIDVGSDAKFTMGAFPDPATGLPAGDTSWNIIFGWGATPWSSFSTVRVDGADNQLGQSTATEAPHVVDPTTNRGAWTIGDVAVTQVLQIVPNNATGQQDTAQISYVLTNNGSSSHTVGLRMMIDDQVDNNDGALFRVPGVGAVTTEQDYLGASIPATFEVFKDITDPVHVASAQTNTGSSAAPSP